MATRTKYRFKSRRAAEDACADQEQAKIAYIRFAMASYDKSIVWFGKHGHYRAGIFDHNVSTHSEEKIVFAFHPKGQRPRITIWRAWSDIDDIRAYANVAATASSQEDRDAYDSLKEAVIALNDHWEKDGLSLRIGI